MAVCVEELGGGEKFLQAWERTFLYNVFMRLTYLFLLVLCTVETDDEVGESTKAQVAWTKLSVADVFPVCGRLDLGRHAIRHA